jgi:hypothetical protein
VVESPLFQRCRFRAQLAGSFSPSRLERGGQSPSRATPARRIHLRSGCRNCAGHQRHKSLTGYRIERSRDDGIIFGLRVWIDVGQRPRPSRIEGVRYARRLFVGGSPVEGKARGPAVSCPFVPERARPRA